MTRTHKAATTTQILTSGPSDHLEALAQTLCQTRESIKDLEKLEAATKKSIVAEFGYGVFEAGGFEVQAQRIAPEAKPILNVDSLSMFLSSIGRGIEDFYVPGKAAAPHDRVNVTPLVVPVGVKVTQLGTGGK